MKNPEIKILYEDNSLLVVDKPSGVVVNKAITQKDNFTLQDWAKEYLSLPDSHPEKENAEDDDTSSDFYSRSGIVHRIDKETSGVLIIAKTPEAFSNLQGQFKKRKIHKKYIAKVYGKFPENDVVVDAPIARNPRNRERFAVVEGGKEAQTTFHLVKHIEEDGEEYSIVECEPKTGRTHQIRVHLTALGHPVVGDKLYSGKKRSKRDFDKFERQYLFAKSIEFKHPETGEVIKIQSTSNPL